MFRTLALSIALFSPLALADEPKRVELTVGQEVSVGYLTTPICDAPSVAVLSADGNGTFKGIGPGRTLCSGETPVGLRQVYEVVVSEEAEDAKDEPDAQDVAK